MSKKGVEELLQEVILPIEEKQVDEGDLYISLASHFDTNPEGSEVKQKYKLKDTGGWPLPSNNIPGEWRISDPIKKKRILLFSLSGLLYHGYLYDKLFKVEYKGDSERICFRNFYTFGRIGEAQEIEAILYDRMNIGLRAESARLVGEVENWTPYRYWMFAIACAKRALVHARDVVGLKPPAIYFEALDIAKAKARARCLGDEQEYCSLLLKRMNSESDFDFYIKFGEEIVPILEKDYTTKYAGKAADYCLEWEDLSKVPNQTRVQYALMPGSYEDYSIPSIFAKTKEEKNLRHRFWYALLKKELDWQVSMLIKYLNDPESDDMIRLI